MPASAMRTTVLASSTPSVASGDTRRSAGAASVPSEGRIARVVVARCNAVRLPATRSTSSRRHDATVVAARAAAPSSSPEAADRRDAAPLSSAASVPAGLATEMKKQQLSNNIVAAPLRSTSPSLGERTHSAWVPPAAPILSGGGGGVFFFWQLGAIDYMSQRYDLDRVHLRGASAGGLAVTLAACGVRALDAAEAAHELSIERGVFDRPTGLAGVWGGVVRDWLDALLPRDAAARCAGRLKLVVTSVPSLRLKTLECFSTKTELIDACLASAHVPFFLDGRGAARFRGDSYVDGSLYDFLYRNNSDVLEAGGRALVLDYCRDDRLEYGRFDFLLKRLDLDGAKALMAAGAEYARRQEELGVLDEFLGSVKREAVASTARTTSSGIVLPSSSSRPRVTPPEAGLAA